MSTGQAAPRTDDDNRDPWGLAVGLWRYKYLVFAIVALSAVAVMAVAYRLPKIYEAECRLQYDPDAPKPLGDDVEAVGDQQSFWSSREFFETQNQILSSRSLAERVVRQLGLNRDPSYLKWVAPSRQGSSMTVEEAATLLQGNITVQQVRGTRLVDIRVQDSSPERARRIANTLASTYRDKTLEDRMSSTVDALDWLSSRLDDSKKRVQESELALNTFRREANILSTEMDSQQNVSAQAIASFSELLRQARGRRIEVSAKLAQLERAKANPLAAAAPLLQDNVTIRALREQYHTIDSELAALLPRYGDEHPEISRRRATLASLGAQIQEETNSVVAGVRAELAEIQQTEAGYRQAVEEAKSETFSVKDAQKKEDELLRERENQIKMYNMLLERTTETDLTKLQQVTNVRIVDDALRPTSPISPNLRLFALGGVLVGLALGLLVVFALDRMDQRLRHASQLEAMGMPIIGMIPVFEGRDEQKQKQRNSRQRHNPKDKGNPVGPSDLVVHQAPHSFMAEAFRSVRTNLTFMLSGERARTLLFTSAVPEDGKSTVAVNVASAMAQVGKRVLLVDADLRRPRLHRVFGITPKHGLTGYLVRSASLADCCHPTEVPDLFVMPCGLAPPNPSELLNSPRFAELIREAGETFDTVIFDSPPVGVVTDAAVIASQVQATVLIARVNHTRRDALRRARRALVDVGARIAGAILNASSAGGDGYGPGYYYYQYAPTPEDNDGGAGTTGSGPAPSGESQGGKKAGVSTLPN